MAFVSKHNETLVCPSCSERLHVGIEYQTPAVVDVFSSSQALAAKVECLRQLETMNIDAETKDSFRLEIGNPTTFIGPGDVKLILGNAKKQYDSKIQTTISKN